MQSISVFVEDATWKTIWEIWCFSKWPRKKKSISQHSSMWVMLFLKGLWIPVCSDNYGKITFLKITAIWNEVLLLWLGRRPAFILNSTIIGAIEHTSFYSDNHSRVVLNVLNDDPLTDYINASYVDVSKLHSLFVDKSIFIKNKW